MGAERLRPRSPAFGCRPRPATAPPVTALHAVALSVRKSGTHLLREATAALGYTLYGGVAWRIVRLVYAPAEIEALTTDEAATLAVRQAVGAYLEAWWVRLGVRGAAALARLADFLGVEADLDAVAHNLFNPAARTFHRGRIGGWKDHFSPRHRALFRDRHGAIADLYGYPT